MAKTFRHRHKRTSAVLDETSISTLLQRLNAAIQSGDLPTSAQKQVEKLAARLSTGVCIVLLGPKGVGKSSLCNAMLHLSGHTNADQTRVFSTGDEVDDDGLSALNLGALAHEKIPETTLGRVQIVDVDCDCEAQVSAMLDYADVVLWCTQSFEPTENDWWARASDPLKDNSFLVLTKADQLAEAGKLQERISALQAVSADEFHSFFPTTTHQISGLLEQSLAVADTQLAASGVKALNDAIIQIASSGQRADLDRAMLLLERHGASLKDVETVVESGVPDSFVPADIVSKSGYVQACDRIIEHSLELAEMTFDEAEEDFSEILAYCGVISEELVETVQAEPNPTEEERHWHDCFEQASDKVMLMTMENDLRSAADAVTILLQLRRDLEFITKKAA